MAPTPETMRKQAEHLRDVMERCASGDFRIGDNSEYGVLLDLWRIEKDFTTPGETPEEARAALRQEIANRICQEVGYEPDLMPLGMVVDLIMHPGLAEVIPKWIELNDSL